MLAQSTHLGVFHTASQRAPHAVKQHRQPDRRDGCRAADARRNANAASKLHGRAVAVAPTVTAATAAAGRSCSVAAKEGNVASARHTADVPHVRIAHHTRSHFHLLLQLTHVTNVVMGSSAERVCSCCVCTTARAYACQQRKASSLQHSCAQQARRKHNSAAPPALT